MTTEYDSTLTMFRERVADYGEATREKWLNWCRIVLTQGGELVVPGFTADPDLDLLLEFGNVQQQPATSLDNDDDCHEQVAKLWADGEIAAVGTGYALSEDGLWRQHSWGVDRDGKNLETKWLCAKYIGVTLPPGEPTVQFIVNNYPGDIKAFLRQKSDRAKEIMTVVRALREQRAD